VHRRPPRRATGGLRRTADGARPAEVLEDPARFDLDEINLALNDPYMQLRDGGADPRLVEILNKLRYTRFGDNLMSLALSRSEVSTADRTASLRPVLWCLNHVDGDGLSLTSAGYLKPDDVTAVAAVMPTMADWIGTANRESHTYPVLWFRESLQKLGLIRKYRGRLLLTKAGSSLRDNPDALWDYIAGRLPIGKTDSMDVPAGLLTLTFVASDPAAGPPLGHIAEALSELGWRHSDRSPVSADAVRWATEDTIRVLENITIDPPRRSERRQFSDVAAQLASDALLNC
jgi:hypothetical protein